MKNLTILSFILLSFLTFIPIKSVFCFNGETEKQPFAIPVEISPGGHIIIKAEINNVEGNFILDTGAGINVITKKFASKLKNIKPEDGGFTGFRATGEALNMKLYGAEEIKLGNLVYRNPIITILDADLGNIDGLISLTCFRTRPFTIDFTNKKIYLETKRSLKERMKRGKTVPIQFDNDRGISLDMFTKVRVNDTLTLQISLDSGAGFNVFRFNSEYMKYLNIDTSKAKKYFKPSTFNKNIGNMFYISNLDKISLYSAPSVQTEKVKASFLKGLIYDGITCINWLGKQITIDIPDKEMIIK